MTGKARPTEGPRPIAVADAHALADRLERGKPGPLHFTSNELRFAAALIRALLRGRKATEIIEVDYR